jgi:hypothetical protein
MDVLAQLAAWSLIAFGLLLFATQVAAREIGYWLGQRHSVLRGTGDAEGVGLITTGMVGLLGFVLALMLSFGGTRFDERRQGTLNEANAIGTAWLRAQALGGPSGEQIATLLKDYVAVRRDYIQADRDPSQLNEINQRSAKLQQDIWSELTKVVRERPDPASVALMSALNEVFDMATSERFAHDNRIPQSLFWLLMVLAHLSMGAIGYQLGLKGQRAHAMASLLTAVWTAVIVVILDLSAPRLGAIRTSVDVYDWVQEDMNGPALETPKLEGRK